MITQPEALRLADALSKKTGHCGGPTMFNAAAELRRLHEENERLKAQPAVDPVVAVAGLITDEICKRLPSPQPAAWVGLTDEEIISTYNEACRECFNGLERVRYHARAIEAKLREKNAAELRRLHEVNSELLGALQSMPHPEHRTGICHITDEWIEWRDTVARAAIAKATGETK